MHRSLSFDAREQAPIEIDPTPAAGVFRQYRDGHRYGKWPSPDDDGGQFPARPEVDPVATHRLRRPDVEWLQLGDPFRTPDGYGLDNLQVNPHHELGSRYIR